MRQAARLVAWCAVALLAAGPAFAQIFPPLPALPGGLPGLPPIAAETKQSDEAAVRSVDELRRARMDAQALLRRRHRDVIDTDRRGALIVLGEALALSPRPEALARAAQAGFTIERRAFLDGLGMEVVVLRAPPGVTTNAGLDALRKLDPAGSYDFNHLYAGSGDQTGAPARPSSVAATSSVEATPSAAGARVGMIDGGVDLSHPAFAGAAITSKAFAGTASPSAHGTEVASLFIGHGKSFVGAAPDAQLFAADVFGAGPTGGSAEEIIEAFAWLAQQRAKVINASIVGPPNKALESVVRAVIAKGILVVAAVGNDGPAAPPLYPAAYPGVVGVTGVDARRKVLPEAGRGPQVDFSAPGADLVAAQPGGGFIEVRGTSFAAPIVAGLLAALSRTEDGARTRADLAAVATDLGAKGWDPVYGHGLVGESVRADPRRFAAR